MKQNRTDEKSRNTQRTACLQEFAVKGPLVALLILLILSCQPRVKSPQQWLSNENYISLLLDSGAEPDFPINCRRTVQAFYDIYDFQLVWSSDGVLRPKGRELIEIIEHCDQYGLFPADYPITFLNSIDSDSLSGVDVTRLDITLTDSYFLLAFQLEHGTLDPATLEPRTLYTPDTLLLISLHKALRGPSILTQLRTHEPDHYFYRTFKTALKELLARRDTAMDAARFDDEILNLQANLERWRWEFRPFPERYIFINIPAYTMYLFERDKIVIKSKVIVGNRENPTPVLTSEVECFLVYPYWHVPRRIAVEELLPSFRKDSSRIRQQHFEVFRDGKRVDAKTIDWTKYNRANFPFSLRQREGIDNALGVIKFVFDNPFGVYLHDTNARNLFNREDRALSHGCIRLEKARELGFYLVKDDPPEVTMELEHALAGRVRREFSLHKPIPIFVRYYTHDGDTACTDIYNQNDKIMRAVANPVFSLIITEPVIAPASPASAGQ